jgi:hypothetical protein
LLLYIYGNFDNEINILRITDHEKKFSDGMKNCTETEEGVVVLLFKMLRNLGHHKSRRHFLKLLRDY